MSHIREKAIAGLNRGDCFTVSRTFRETDTMAFADISRDYNPVHFDDRFAQVKNLRGQICHGLLVASLVTEIGGQIGWLASEMDFRFRKPVYFGDTIECRLTITELHDRNRAKAEAVFKNQCGEIVIEASLAGLVPWGSRKVGDESNGGGRGRNEQISASIYLTHVSQACHFERRPKERKRLRA